MPRRPRPISMETLSRNFLRAKVRTQIADLARLSDRLRRVNDETLGKAGWRVREAAKRGIGQAPPKQPKSQNALIVMHDGGLYRDITAIHGNKPRSPGKPVKSWEPKRFTYYDIVYFLDSTTGTVVIGPYRAPWLNQLHEFGGQQTQRQYRIGKEVAWQAAEKYRRGGRSRMGNQSFGAIIWSKHAPGRNSKTWERTGATRTVTYPARPFMQGSASVQKALAKANTWFRDTFFPARAA